MVILTGGLFFRLWQLNDRPMHTDEAVHAEKFGALLEKGSYFYDPDEFHGPTLNYATLVSAWLRGEKSYASVQEATLRLVPAVFGFALVLTPLLFLSGLSRRTVFFGSLLLAFSPAFVYYSRYYIQETQLVFFTATMIGCGWQYVRSRNAFWLILSGISIGLMHATKETFVFTLFAAAIAFFVCIVYDKSRPRLKISHCAAAVAAMVLTSILFYSSFGTNWQGVPDSVGTYLIWLKRAGGQTVHLHPWYYYLDLLTWLELAEPITWNEDGIVALAAFSLFFMFSRKPLAAKSPALFRFFAVYTVALTAVYSLIPYKTPWCLLSFFYGMTMLAAFVVDWLIKGAEAWWEKIGIGLLLGIFVIVSPIAQTWLLNFRYASAPTNPYVYAHTSTDIYTIVEGVDRAVAASLSGEETPIQVVAAGSDYWPLPWYLRAYPNVGYWAEVNPAVCTAPIILSAAAHRTELLNVLYTVPEPGSRHLYVPLYDRKVQLRPAVEWMGVIRNNLWERMNAASQTAPLLEEKSEADWMDKPDKKQIENLLKFSHEAMNTTFAVFVQDDRGSYAGRAARAAFNEVDRLEEQLSRFIPNSDISRINRLPAGQSAMVSEDTMQCLSIAEKAYGLTEGAFDISIGWAIEAAKNGDTPLQGRPAGKAAIRLDEDLFSVTKSDDTVNIDLGGIGKGYAVDVIAKVLEEWGVKTVLIHGGASSVRAVNPPEGKPGWPVTITNPADGKQLLKLELANEVLSCSGLEKGGHIIDPATGKPPTGRVSAWVRLPQSAALADALSTAVMIMPLEKIQQLPRHISGLSVLLVMAPDTGGEPMIKLGEWDSEFIP